MNNDFALKKRFSEELGEEYSLFESVYPHFNAFQEKIANELAQKCDKKEWLVLEIGCGPGPTSIRLLEANPKIKLICIDNEEKMISQAMQGLKKYKNRVEFVNSDALSFLKSSEDTKFDAIVSGWTIHNFNDEYRNNVLKEILRVLKNKGVFINGDNYALDDLNKRYKEFYWSVRQLLKIYSKMKRYDHCYKWIMHIVEDEKEGVIMTEGKSIENMLSIGFNNPNIVWRKHMQAVLVASK